MLFLVLRMNNNFLNKTIRCNSGLLTSQPRPNYQLDLIFLRNRFFPQLTTYTNNNVIFNASLGVVSNYFSKKKSFLRSKSSYIILATYIRRVLVSANLSYLNLKVKGLPAHLKALIKTILTRSNSLYKDPYNIDTIKNETSSEFSFIITFSQIVFINNKFYGIKKVKQQGRLKRKIFRRVVNLNSILD